MSRTRVAQFQASDVFLTWGSQFMPFQSGFWLDWAYLGHPSFKLNFDSFCVLSYSSRPFVHGI